MKTNSINISKVVVGIALSVLISVTLLPLVVIAHGGDEHVIGIVAKISPTSVTVTTIAGKTVAVAFDAKTTYSRADQVIAKKDIKVGDRVVIHAIELNEKLVAHMVQVGSAQGTKPH